MKQSDPHFKMRLSPELKAKITDAAKTAGRSMNAEIVQRLEQSFNSRQLGSEEVFLRSQITGIEAQVCRLRDILPSEVIDPNSEAERLIRAVLHTHVTILIGQKVDLEARLKALLADEAV